jgi:hypothetical protein
MGCHVNNRFKCCIHLQSTIIVLKSVTHEVVIPWA